MFIKSEYPLKEVEFKMPYFECVACARSLLGSDLGNHLRAVHSALIDANAQITNDEALAVQNLIDACVPTTQGPVPIVPASALQRVGTTRSDRLGITSSFGFQNVKTIGSGDSLSELEVQLFLASLETYTNWTVDAQSAIASLIIFFVGNDASDKSDEGGIYVHSRPLSIPAAAAGTSVPTTQYIPYSQIKAAGVAALAPYKREFTARRLARALYPVAYEQRTSEVFSELNTMGTARTQNWSWPPSQWYLTVSWVSGVAFTPAESVLLAQASKLIGPVDAIIKPDVVDSTPQSLAAAEARKRFQDLSASVG